MNVWVGRTPPICCVHKCMWCEYLSACGCAVYVNVLCMRACVAYMSVYGRAHDKVSKSYRTKYTIANNCMIQWQHIDCTCIGYL